jgi:hypothetical protein
VVLFFIKYLNVKLITHRHRYYRRLGLFAISHGNDAKGTGFRFQCNAMDVCVCANKYYYKFALYNPTFCCGCDAGAWEKVVLSLSVVGRSFCPDSRTELI